MTTVRRIDFLGPAHCDPERSDGVCFRLDADGFLRGDARLTRTGVFRYADKEGHEWGELRTEDEVFDPATLRSFQLKTVTDDHPADFVSTKNVKDVQIGTIGTDVRRDGEYTRSSIVITDAKAIRSIQDGKIELSCGYEADVIQDSGTTDSGVPFSARQTNIRGNHLALVSRGRAGPSCALLIGRGDAFSILTERIPMKTKKVKVGDTTFEVPEAVADALEAKAQAAPEPPVAPVAAPAAPVAAAPVAAPTDPAPTTVAASDELARLRATVDGMVADRAADSATETARIDARVSLVSTAREVLGADVVTTGVADADLMRSVVLAVRPTETARIDANASMPGYLQHAYESAVERHRDGVANVQSTNVAVFGAVTVTDAERATEDAELDDAINRFYCGPQAAAEGVGA
jgi:hypothetical protein